MDVNSLSHSKWNRKYHIVNITVRQSRQSGVARATCPDITGMAVQNRPEYSLDTYMAYPAFANRWKV